MNTDKKIITLIRGDGIGPEVIDSALEVLSALDVKLEFEEVYAGESALEKFNTPLPKETIQSIKKNKIVLKGPLTTPIATGFRSINVALRQIFDLYACVRPCRLFKGIKSNYEKIDLVVIRENTEDLYCGIEYEPGSKEIKNFFKLDSDTAVSLKVISKKASQRIIEFAFKYAKQNNRKKLTVVTKANILKATDGLFLETAREISKKYPEIEYDEKLIDNMCMQLVVKPHLYDVITSPNLYGDIISDLCAGLVGGLGVTPSANIGDECAIFEPIHGSAPKYKNQNKVNPIATILAAAMLLEYIGEKEKSEKIKNAVEKTILDGKKLSYDLGGNSSTKEVTKEIINNLQL